MDIGGGCLHEMDQTAFGIDANGEGWTAPLESDKTSIHDSTFPRLCGMRHLFHAFEVAILILLRIHF